ncbi:MAG: PAS domain S-box protein [Planctomycetaceae bacterium]|nr:PAS domain S-box protein [Planctomycetaceae bacterium]
MTDAETPKTPDLTSDQIRLLLEGLSDHAIFSMDAQGRIQTWNKGAARIYGYTLTEIRGQQFQILHAREEKERRVPEETLRKARDQRAVVEGRRVRKDGRGFWAYSEISAVRDVSGEVVGYVDITCDVSERKEKGEELARSEEAFRLLVQSVQDYAIYMLDRRGNVVSWNPGAQRIKGYTAEEIVGEHYSRFFTPEDIASNKPHENLRIASEQGHYEADGWRVRKDGTRFWANVALTALRDDQGRLRGFAKVTRDISGRKRSDELLRQSEERYRQLVDGIRDYAVYMLSPEGMITSWNAGAERVKGYHADEVIGKHVSLFYTPDDVQAKRPELELRLAAERGRFNGEGWKVRRDGTYFWAEVTMTAIRDDAGKLRGFAKITRDVTAERKSMDDLRRAEERFRLLVEGVREYAIYMLDPNGRVASWNPGAERLKGYRADEIIGKPHSTFYTPEDQKAGKPARLLDLAASEGQARDEGWRVRKDGRRFWADVLLTALYDGGGLLRGYSKVTRDLTERQKRDEEVRRLNQGLQEKITDLDAFASTVAHDVASPLRAIASYTDMVVEDYGKSLPEEAQLHLQRVQSAARHMRRLLEDLLAYSRLSHAEIQPVPTDLEALIEEVLLEMAHALGESKAKVLQSKPYPKVLANATLLRQALTNLISNAVKFARPGVPPAVTVATERRGKDVRITVTDNGIGIGPADVQRLFQPFERLGPAKGYAGTGLGLAIVRRAVERMDGRVGMEPAPEAGTRFWIELPGAGA